MDKDKSNVAITAPCPFCGATPEDHDEGSPLLGVVEEDDGNIYSIFVVACAVCGAHGPYAFDEEVPEQLWNERAPSEAGEKERTPEKQTSHRAPVNANVANTEAPPLSRTRALW